MQAQSGAPFKTASFITVSRIVCKERNIGRNLKLFQIFFTKTSQSIPFSSQPAAHLQVLNQQEKFGEFGKSFKSYRVTAAALQRKKQKISRGCGYKSLPFALADLKAGVHR